MDVWGCRTGGHKPERGEARVLGVNLLQENQQSGRELGRGARGSVCEPMVGIRGAAVAGELGWALCRWEWV